MFVLAVIGFVLLNIIGIIFVPRVTAMAYIWYVFVQLGFVGEQDQQRIVFLFTAVASIGAAVLDWINFRPIKNWNKKAISGLF